MSFAIQLDHVSKKFKIFHEKRNSFFEFVTNIGNKNKNFEYLNVLDDVSFSVNKGETFGIIGKNGTGKTTLLRLISKIYKPDSGTVSTQGSIVPLLQLGIGFHPELTSYDNIMTYGILLGFSKQWIKSKIPEILSFAELEKFADVKIKNFSSGMYARLAFSTAVQVDPDILLVDEVLAVGDLTFKKKCVETFDDFKRRKKTILFVSHDTSTVLRICDRAMVLREGKIDKIGNPQEVVDYYINSNK